MEDMRDSELKQIVFYAIYNFFAERGNLSICSK
jgi:hypothetical protein